MPETTIAPNQPAGSAAATASGRNQLTDLQVAALSAENQIDRAAAAKEGRSGDGSDLMKALQENWDERTGARPAGVEEQPAAGEQAEEQAAQPAKADSASRVPKLPSKPTEPRMKPKTSADWKAAEEASAKRQEAALAAARTQWEAETSAQQKELAELREWRQVLDLQSDPEFQKKYTAQHDYLTRQVKNIAGEKGKELIDLLGQSTPAALSRLDELVSALPESSQRLVKAVQANIYELSLRRDMELEAARQKASAFQERRAAEAASQAASRKATFRQVLEQAASNGLDVFSTKGDAKHDALAQSLRQQAESYYNGEGFSDSDRATLAIWATLGPRYAESYASLLTEHQSLREQFDRMQGTVPGAGEAAGDVTDGASGRGKDPSRMSTDELQADMFKKLEAAQKNTWGELRRAANVYGA